jgi:hypothetical protein
MRYADLPGVTVERRLRTPMRVTCRAILASLWLGVAAASLHAQVPTSPAVVTTADDGSDPAPAVT